MNDLLNLVTTHGDKIGVAVLAVHAAAIAITNLTPTPKDDRIVRKAYRVVEIFAGILTAKAKMR